MNFVPVAVNLYSIRKERSAAGDFFREIQKQRPNQYQGIYIVSPTGKVLSTQAKQPEGAKSWTNDLLDVIDEGLKAYGRVNPREVELHEPQPYRGQGVRKDGNIDLAVSGRWMLFGLERRGFGKPMFDRIELEPSDIRSLALAEVSAGTEWTVPKKVVEKFHRLLSPVSDANQLATMEEVTTAKLKGKVMRISAGVAYLQFTGEIVGEHVYQFDPNKGKKSYAKVSLTGVGTADSSTGRILTFTLVGDGVHRSPPPYDQPAKFGVIAEWKRR